MRHSRWSVLVACMYLELAGGSVYITNLYLSSLRPLFFGTRSDGEALMEYLVFASNLGNWLPVSGFIYDWKHGGPRRVVLAGAALTLVGYGGLYLCASRQLGASFWQLCLLWFLWGHGSGYFDCAAISTGTANFGESRGLVVGLTKSFYGLSGSLLAQLFHAFFFEPSDAPAFLLSLGLSLSAIAVACVPFVERMPPPPQPSADSPHQRFAAGYALVLALALSMTGAGLLRAFTPLGGSRPFALATLGLVVVALLALPSVARGAAAAAASGAWDAEASNSPNVSLLRADDESPRLSSDGASSDAPPLPLPLTRGEVVEAGGMACDGPAGSQRADGSRDSPPDDAGGLLRLEPLCAPPLRGSPYGATAKSVGAIPAGDHPPAGAGAADGAAHAAHAVGGCESAGELADERAGERAGERADERACVPVGAAVPSLISILLSLNFVLLFVTAFAGFGGGIVLLNHIGKITLAAQLGAGGAAAAAKTSSILVSLLSTFNCLGRMGAGIGSDALHSRVSRPVLLAAALLLQGLTHAALLGARASGVLYVCTCTGGAAYGAVWALLPSTVGDLFPPLRFATLYSCYSLAASSSSLLLSTVLATRVYAAHADAQGECFGDLCYRDTHLAVVAVSAAGALCALELARRNRHLLARSARAD